MKKSNHNDHNSCYFEYNGYNSHNVRYFENNSWKWIFFNFLFDSFFHFFPKPFVELREIMLEPPKTLFYQNSSDLQNFGGFSYEGFFPTQHGLKYRPIHIGIGSYQTNKCILYWFPSRPLKYCKDIGPYRPISWKYQSKPIPWPISKKPKTLNLSQQIYINTLAWNLKSKKNNNKKRK